MKEFIQDIDRFNLYEFEEVIDIDRDVDVGKYIPQDIIGKGAEFIKIREIENMELSKLWMFANKIMKNLYIQSFDIEGLKSYKQLIDDDSIKGDLEQQRKLVYALWNKEVIWTHRTLLNWLDGVVGANNYEVEILYNDYEVIFELKVQKGQFNVPWLSGELRKIIPANLLISFRLYILDILKIIDKTDTYKTRYWMVNEVPCGRVPEQAYKGKKFIDRVSVGNTSSVKHNRPYQVNEIKSGGAANK